METYHDDGDGNTSTTIQHWSSVDGTLSSAEQKSSNEDEDVEVTLTPAYVRLDADKHEREVTLEGIVIPRGDDDDYDLHGLSTLERDANGALVSFRDSAAADGENDKDFLSDPFGTIYRRHGKTQHFRAYPDDTGAHVVR